METKNKMQGGANVNGTVGGAKAAPPTASSAPDHYPEWLKTVYTELQDMVSCSRLAVQLPNQQLLGWMVMVDRICAHLYLSSVHYTNVSNVELEQLGDLDTVKEIVTKYAAANAEKQAEATSEEG